MAYATAAELAAYMGRSAFSGSQLTQANLYLDAATSWIDDQTGRTWSITSPITELHTINGNYLYLNHKPITDVTSINVRPNYPGSSDTLLVADVGYEILDAAKGLIAFSSTYPWLGTEAYRNYVAEVIYTHAIAVPANIKLACMMLAAIIMNNTINPAQQRIRSYNDNRAISVTFKDDNTALQPVKDLLPSKQLFVV